MNNKGFTLIELLAVVVILLAISVIAISSISSAVERTRDKQDNAKIENLKTYAKIYYDEHKNSVHNCVTVAELIPIYKISSEEIAKSDGTNFDGSFTPQGKYCAESKDCTGTCS